MAHWRLRRLVTRGRVKWIGLSLAVVVGLLLLQSIWTVLTFNRSGTFREDGVAFTRGRMWFSQSAASWETERNSMIRYELQHTAGLDLWWERRWFDGVLANGAQTKGWYLAIPLWFPLLLIALPTAYLWRTDRRAKPWQCPKCRYDLRGLDGGVCPECGHRSTTRSRLLS